MRLYLHCDSSLHLEMGFVAYGYVLSKQARADTILMGEGIFAIKGSTISRHFELWGIKQALIDCKHLLPSCGEIHIRNDSWQAIHTLQRVITFPEADHAIDCIECICKGKTIRYNQVTAIGPKTLDQLNEELAAAGWDSLHTEVREAREAVARLLHYTFGPFDLHDSETSDIVREATAEEAAESANAGPEGHIIACGRKCYVLP